MDQFVARSAAAQFRTGLWEAPSRDRLSTEDLMLLIYLLLSPFRHATGLFAWNERVAAAHIGWDREQLRKVVSRLVDANEINIEDGWVWVRSWWDHNNRPGPGLAQHFREHLSAAPDKLLHLWRADAVARGYPVEEWLGNVGTRGTGGSTPPPTPGGPPLTTKPLTSNEVISQPPPQPPLSGEHSQSPAPSPYQTVDDLPNCSQRDTDVVGGGVFDIFFDAAGRPDKLARERAKLSAILAKANPDQARFAGIAWRDTIDAGKATSLVGLAVQLCRRAAKGEVTPPTSVVHAAQDAQVEARRAAWGRLKALSGRKYRKFDANDITFEIYGEVIYIHRATSDRPLTTGGAEALRVLASIEAGELVEVTDHDVPLGGASTKETKSFSQEQARNARHEVIDTILANLPDAELRCLADGAANAAPAPLKMAVKRAVIQRRITTPAAETAVLAALHSMGATPCGIDASKSVVFT